MEMLECYAWLEALSAPADQGWVAPAALCAGRSAERGFAACRRAAHRTMNLEGPAWGSYSRHTPPSSTSLPFSLCE